VRQLLDTLRETPENLAARAAVRAQIMIHLARLGDPEDQATSLFREGKELATRSGDPHVLSQVLNGFGHLRLLAGAVTEALDPLLEAVRRADETEDISLRVAVRYGPSNAYWWAGRLRECATVTEQGLGLARGNLNFGTDLMGFSPSLGLSVLQDALEALEKALEITRERRLLSVESGVLGVNAAAHLGLGDRAKAVALAEEAIGVGRRRGSRFREFSALLTRSRALRETLGLQATREIEATLAEADAWLEMSGAKSYEPFLHVGRAELARLVGDENAHQRELREAHRLFVEIGAPIRAEQVAKELAG
jgi:tetratricopeptide (TPR) repeat protein